MLSDVFSPARMTRPAVWEHPNGRRASRRLTAAARRVAAVLLAVVMLSAPAAALGVKGQKNFRRGLEHEAAQQWEKAVEEFALAVAADPSNAEYQLHYRRAVFNASQLFMQQGAAHAERGDYIGAYNAYRRAYAYDQSNELARSLTERMQRMQLDKEGGADPDARDAALPAAARVSPTSYEAVPDAAARRRQELPQTGRSEQLRVITYNGDLEGFIKYLARQLRLNAIFDKDFPQRTVNVDLQDVTAAQALDYTFLTQGLFFQKLSSRTILVADQLKRPQYQQLVLRTFYLSNIDPNDARALIQASIPPQAGRQPVITANKMTNSITVRDTVENVRLVSELLRSVDKERAEVVMDVQIYEVSRTDLMQLGNQLGDASSLGNLGGIQKGLSVLAGSRQVVTQAVAAPTALGAALLIPPSALSAIQRRDHTRLIASTQVHAFDGEKSTAHIGQRVPVQTATVTPFGSVGTGEAKPQEGVAAGLFGSNGYPVIQYEKTGLTLEFTPQVAPNLDVQVKMSIKSNDVSAAGGTTLTPTFTERNIEGTARIQNNRTMMIASVAQNQQMRGRQGLPLLGLMPVLGRLFTAPRRNDQQTDIVIAVTPHVLRAPTYTPHDEEMRPSGTMQTPNSDTLEAIIQEADREEQLAAARAIPRHTKVELPDAETPPSYVPAPKLLMNSAAANASAASAHTRPAAYLPATEASQPPANEASLTVAPTSAQAPTTAAHTSAAPLPVSNDMPSAGGNAPAAAAAEVVNSPPVPASAAARNTQTAARGFPNGDSLFSTTADAAGMSAPAAPPRSAAQLMLMPEPQRMAVGERRQLKLVLKTDAPLGLLASTLRFDPRVVAVRSVAHGNIFPGAGARPLVTHSVSADGVLLLTVAPPAGQKAFTGAGVLVTVEIEALAPGASDISFTAEDVHLMATDGRKILLRVLPGSVTVSH